MSQNEKIEKGQDSYIDDRGEILNYYLENKINHVGLINSTKGSVRGNHYHPEQIQSCLLIKGSYLSVTKNLNIEKAPIETRLIKAGDISIIKENIAHTMVFLEESIFINLVDGERAHENYGQTHTFPIELVNKNLAEIYLKNYKKECRLCEGTDLEFIHSFGLSPLANNLSIVINQESTAYPLELNFCQECSNVQLNTVVDAKLLFDQYLYTSSTSKVFVEHFEKIAETLVEKFQLDKNSFVVDIGSNDGIFLKPLKRKGIKVLGIEPAANLAKLANKEKLTTINAYFDSKTVNQIKVKYGHADIVTAFNVFAHSDFLKEIAEASFNLLKKDGVFVIEVQSLAAMVEEMLFDNVYHEHVNYWSLTNLISFFQRLNLHVNDFENVDTHGGSLRVYISRNSGQSDSVKNQLDYEEQLQINKLETFYDFSNKLNTQKTKIYKKLKTEKEAGKKILFYGAPAKATTLLNYYGIDSNIVKYTVEDNPFKVGKFIPNTNIEIIDTEAAISFNPDLIVVLAWNFFESIKDQNKETFKNSTFVTLNSLI
jgi:2-polyprenyl-3-methyl-5-hydroxy-6-metoxy-1,4-benzoquinol methylase/dTDP-4-dehydrorhamnose 3,5-epimerase-like enzyme